MGVLLGMGEKAAPRVPDILVPAVNEALWKTAKKVKIMRERLINSNGNTAGGEFRFLGSIEPELFYGNRAFFEDDDNCRRWLRENHAFRVGKL